MRQMMKFFPWAAGLFISAIFLDSLRFKFSGHPTPEHIFTTLREWSGIGLFFPAGPWIIGLGELLSSILLIGAPVVMLLTKQTTWLGKSQFAGALIAFGIMSGAIVFHLFTPLGISTPIEWDGDTPTEFSAALFYSACASWLFALSIMYLRKDAILRN